MNGLVLVLLVGVIAATMPAAEASTSSTVIGATVLSASTLGLAGCVEGSSALQLGSVTVASSNVTSASCAVEFGSTNDTASLRIQQTDALGQALWRQPHGTIDSSFGTAGATAVDLSGVDIGARIARDSAGRIYVSGSPGSALASSRITRLLASGLIDLTYGTAGTVTIDVAPGNEAVRELIVDGSDRLLAVVTNSTPQPRIARITPGGALDPAFASSGIATSAFAFTGSVQNGNALVVDASGRIVYLTASASSRLHLARYTPNGQPDVTFGTAGVSEPAIASQTISTDLLALGDGRLYVAGSRASTFNALVVIRVTASGGLDGSWAAGGYAQMPMASGNTFGTGIAVDSQNRVYASNAIGGNMTIGRFDAGANDPTFGTNGLVTIDAGTASDWGGGGLVIDPLGYVTVLGATATSGAAARVTPAGALDTTFGTGGIATVAGTQVGSSAIERDGGILLGVQITNDVGVLRLDTTTVPDLSSGVADWSAGTSAFGACLTSAVGSTAVWTAGSCTAANSASWQGVPNTTPGVIATQTAPSPTTSTANLRFGFRTTAAQPAGRYTAPVTFTVIAPG